MNASRPVRGRLTPPDEDIVSKHGKRVVVIVFCILAGDALPTILQNGLSPKEKFYTIVAVTLPYTGSLALVFLYLMKAKTQTIGHLMVAGLILLAGFVFAVALNWGVTDAEADVVNRRLWTVNHPRGRSAIVGPPALMNSVKVVLGFYYAKFGAPLFVGGTLAAFVLGWNLMRWTEKPTSD